MCKGYKLAIHKSVLNSNKYKYIRDQQTIACGTNMAAAYFSTYWNTITAIQLHIVYGCTSLQWGRVE